MCGLKMYAIKILTQKNIGVATNTLPSIRSNCKVRNDKSFLKTTDHSS